MATYTEIDAYVRRTYGYVPKPCWIAHVKAHYRLNCGPFGRARNHERKVKCPPQKWQDIEAALEHFGMVSRSDRSRAGA
ncbi:MAG: hypothetical protein KIT11_09905 [Fimbriimonadaceae bacterium]|nr:hypothetical protein [Fimbriimonadaceae bacterium]QYK55638.1 MAG: hypothetical protein KF733_11575 [Fimbriimonadaceae bacterium]